MITSGFICQSVKKKCYNPYDSYGEICVGCNCCGRIDMSTMYKCRIETDAAHLKEFAEDLLDESYDNFQKRNCASSIQSFAQNIIDSINAIEQEATHDT